MLTKSNLVFSRCCFMWWWVYFSIFTFSAVYPQEEILSPSVTVLVLLRTLTIGPTLFSLYVYFLTEYKQIILNQKKSELATVRLIDLCTFILWLMFKVGSNYKLFPARWMEGKILFLHVPAQLICWQFCLQFVTNNIGFLLLGLIRRFQWYIC